jgi:hypothetical protein
MLNRRLLPAFIAPAVILAVAFWAFAPWAGVSWLQAGLALLVALVSAALVFLFLFRRELPGSRSRRGWFLYGWALAVFAGLFLIYPVIIQYLFAWQAHAAPLFSDKVRAAVIFLLLLVILIPTLLSLFQRNKS